MSSHLPLPLFKEYQQRRFILESFSQEGVSTVPMLDIVKSLKSAGYNNDKILKLKNMLVTDEKSDVALEDLTDAFISMGMDQNKITSIITNLTLPYNNKDEKSIYVVHNNEFYLYSPDEWKVIVDNTIKNNGVFDPSKKSMSIERPKHLYKSDADSKYYSSLPTAVVYNTQNWTLKDFVDMKNNNY